MSLTEEQLLAKVREFEERLGDKAWETREGQEWVKGLSNKELNRMEHLRKTSIQKIEAKQKELKSLKDRRDHLAASPYGTNEGDTWLGVDSSVGQRLKKEEGLTLIHEMMTNKEGKLEDHIYTTKNPELIAQATEGHKLYLAEQAKPDHGRAKKQTFPIRNEEDMKRLSDQVATRQAAEGVTEAAVTNYGFEDNTGPTGYDWDDLEPLIRKVEDDVFAFNITRKRDDDRTFSEEALIGLARGLMSFIMARTGNYWESTGEPVRDLDVLISLRMSHEIEGGPSNG